jgi:Protein of unknown function (DUF4245)
MSGMSEQPGRYQRSFGGMLGALLVLVLGIGVFVVLRDVTRVDPPDAVRPVDYVQPARFAQQAAEFQVLTPRALPEGWTPTSVRFRPTADDQSWHVGVLTAQQRYVGIEQAERPVGTMVADFVDEDAQKGGQVEVAGRSWTIWTDPGRDPGADPSTAPQGDLALVREDGGVTTLVVGTVSQNQLAEFVASLR